ncbi:single-stranded DNA-binding protein [uncultured Lactobacillus sp.]|uniref:single-stranded DNA-binding protein n=1 Tax=uncultured Lactobacillus sp. TaxID=153152 RepID=UPI002611C0F8|nr:single-stranded DNA-binding protein [uncultured Lactobacillus sp.]
MINNVTLEGRLTKHPQLNTTGSGKSVVQFTIAVERSYKNPNGDRDADFINIVAWGKTAEFVNNFFNKGNGINLLGSIQTRTYDNQNGEKVWVTEVVAREVGFPIQNKDKNPEEPKAKQPTPSSDKTNAPSQEHKMDDPFASNSNAIDISDNDLPF